MTMSVLSLATVTAVDAAVEPRKIHRRGGKLVFHSEAERKAWLWGVEQHNRRERERLKAESESALVQAERALLATG